MKPFDDQFADNVRDVFDAWEEPVDEQAWQQMKTRLQPAGKTLGMIPLWYRAAAAVFVLGVLGFSAWLLQQPGGQDFQMAESSPLAEPTEQLMPPSLASADSIESGLAAAEALEMASASVRTTGFATPLTPAGQLPHPGSQLAETIPVTAPAQEDDLNPLLPIELLHTQPGLAENHAVALPSDEEQQTPAAPFPSVLTDQQIISENLAMLKAEERAGQQLSYVELSAGTLKTWSGAEIMRGMGLAAGVAGHWPLGQRLSLSSGGSLVYNQFNINEGGYLRSGLFYDAIHSLPDYEIAQQVNVLDRQVSTDFEFMALDIPINVRYTLHQMNRSSLYVSAGISSLVYLQQSYQTKTDVMAEVSGISAQGNYFSNTNSITTVQSDDFGLFSRLDFARFLNLSAGYVIKGKAHSLVIEPYIKYPLGGITSLNFQIGMAGISLKYRPEFN